MAGDSEILILPENGRTLAEKIPGAEFREIEGAGHLFWISHPNETYSAVAGFLGENEARASGGTKGSSFCFHKDRSMTCNPLS
jgi:hypothetical protein